MIKELHLKNWKSFGESTLYIDPLSILIGTNASGKSNVFDALQFLHSFFDSRYIAAPLEELRGGEEFLIRGRESEATLGIVFQIQDEEYTYKVSIGRSDEEGLELELKSESLTRNGENELKLFYTQRENNDARVFLYAQDGRYRVSPIFDELLSVYYQLGDFQRISNELLRGMEGLKQVLSRVQFIDPIPSFMRQFSTLADQIKPDASNIAGVLAALKTQEKRYAEDILTDYLKQLTEQEIKLVWAEPVGRLSRDAMLYCQEAWDEETLLIDARGLSDGTLRFLGIMTALLTAKEGSLLLIEEVDNGLHPSRAKVLVEFLQKVGQDRKVDVLCTTHNPAFLDALGNEMILFVSLVYRDQETGASKITLLEDLGDFPKIMARGTLGKVSTLGLLEKSVQ